MIYKKFTNGFVEQVFDENGNLISQQFFNVGDTDCEDENGDMTGEAHEKAMNFYHPFDMVQPEETNENKT